MKVILFDADGVLTLPEEFFSRVYARSHGLDPEPFEEFFRGPFGKTGLGQADLKDLLVEYADLWQHEDPEAIMKQWFESEDIRNEPVIELIPQFRAKGIKCYLATNQEKYRGKYMKDVMFPGLFDGYFVSAELGAIKPQPEYFEKVLSSIRQDIPDIKPKDIVFIDDSSANISGAASFGIDARLYEGVTQIKDLLKGAGV